jgi:hypothetical protein
MISKTHILSKNKMSQTILDNFYKAMHKKSQADYPPTWLWE